MVKNEIFIILGYVLFGECICYWDYDLGLSMEGI